MCLLDAMWCWQRSCHNLFTPNFTVISHNITTITLKTCFHNFNNKVWSNMLPLENGQQLQNTFFTYTFFLDSNTFFISEKLDINRDANDKEGADTTEFIITINTTTWPFEFYQVKCLCWEYSRRFTRTNTCYDVYNLLEYQKMQHAMSIKYSSSQKKVTVSSLYNDCTSIVRVYLND